MIFPNGPLENCRSTCHLWYQGRPPKVTIPAATRSVSAADLGLELAGGASRIERC